MDQSAPPSPGAAGPNLFDLLPQTARGSLFDCSGRTSSWRGSLTVFPDRIVLDGDIEDGSATTIRLDDITSWWTHRLDGSFELGVESHGPHTTTLPAGYQRAVDTVLEARLPDRHVG